MVAPAVAPTVAAPTEMDTEAIRLDVAAFAFRSAAALWACFRTSGSAGPTWSARPAWATGPTKALDLLD
ncbi:MAG: hypothetical protein ACR2PO_04145 [Methyloligellaceae bacterium]